MMTPGIETITMWLATVPVPDAETAGGLQMQSVWDYVVKGGILMIPIGICSLLTVTLITERLTSLRRQRIVPKAFLPALKKSIKEDGFDRKKLLTVCKKYRSPAANVMTMAIKRLGMPLEVIERHIEESGMREQLKLRRFLRGLSVIAAVSPLLGLLGTIFGMIEAFQTVADSGDAMGQAEMLATGIYQAMVTTAAGLIVAIPALLGYHFIAARVDRLVVEMDSVAAEFIEELIDHHLNSSATSTLGAPAPSNGIPAEIKR